MYLKRLEIHGFKSFANKTTMEFSQGIIAIVGPNGSGKSNVADSLRWVLGEQSAKIIRGKQSQDVIFAGSEKKTKMGFAEVFATFDNRDRRIPVDASEVSIGRRVDRSGESEYLINGNKVRLLDIVDLVLRSNIGTSRYTVIGQGTIDQMILAGPSEIKNLLDEASGVKSYYMKRDRTLRRLEQTAQNLMRAEDLMAEIEPRLKSLRRQAKRMEARAEFEQELKIHQREYFGKTYWGLKKTLEGYAAQLQILEVQKNKLEQLLKDLREKAQAEEHVSNTGRSAFQEIQQQLTKLQHDKNKLLEELSLIRGKMQSQKTGGSQDAASLQVDIHARQRTIAETLEKITQAKKTQEEAHAGIAAKTLALSEISKKLEELYQVMQNPVQVDWTAFDRELVSLETSFENFSILLERTSDVSEVRQSAATLKQNFSRFSQIAKNGVSGPQNDHKQIQDRLKTLLAEKEQVQQFLQRLELDFSKTHLQLEFLEKQHADLSQEKLHLELELKKSESVNSEEFIKTLIVEEQKVQAQVDAIGSEASKIELLFTNLQHEEQERQRKLIEVESSFRRQQDELSRLKDNVSSVLIEKAKYDAQMDVLSEEVRRMLGPEELAALAEKPVLSNTQDLEGKILRLKNQLDMIGGMDELTLKEYQETETRYTTLSSQVTDLKTSMQDLRNILDELDGHIKIKFNEAFEKINEKFEYYFRVLFNGGRAYLNVLKAADEAGEEQSLEEQAEAEDNAVTDKLRPEEKIVQKYEKGASNIVGIDIKATPPGKKLANIQALSGGERALTSIALLCSLLTCFPSPFVVLDEVDAALDDANTIRFGQILGTLAHQTQFITITHNRETMGQSGMLYGVTMGDDGISKLLSVKLEQAKAFAK